MKNPLLQIVKNRSKISFEEFMQEALQNKDFGYYKNQQALGKNGDFTTSPEISQIFGEIIGSYIAYTWQCLGSPKEFHIIELGAGKGTLLDDILRSTSKLKDFHDSIKITILEINPLLISQQKTALSKYSHISSNWISSIEHLDINSQCFILSNEFFDALATKQYRLNNTILEELFVRYNPHYDSLQYTYMPTEGICLEYNQSKKDIQSIIEISPQSITIFQKLLDIIKIHKGCILTIDYGYIDTPNKNSIRGFYQHQLLSLERILEYAPNCDITYNVNFQSLQNLVSKNNLTNYKILTQEKFLVNCAIIERSEQLISKANFQEDKNLIKSSTEKLINPKQMGEIFKFMICSSKDFPVCVFEKI